VAVINSLASGRRHNSKPSDERRAARLSPEIRAAIEATVKRLYVDANVEAFSIEEFCLRYGVGRQLAYDEIKAGRLVAVKAGGSRRTLIRRVAANAGSKPRRRSSRHRAKLLSRRTPSHGSC